MRARIVSLGAAAAAALVTGTFLVLLVARVPAHRPDPEVDHHARLLHEQARPTQLPAPWQIGTRMAALREMTVEVEAERLSDAAAIAWHIVEDEWGPDYDEILVYVRERGDPTATVRRVQWTRRGGYAQLTFAGASP